MSVVLATGLLSDTAQAATTTGTLAVVVTDSVGAPLATATVGATSDGTTWHQVGLSQPLGTYQLRLAPGSYRIRVTAADGAIVDYVPGSSTIDGAATFTVVAGATTTVNEQLTQSANVQVSLVDKVTGQPVADGCVSITGYSANVAICDHPDGRYLFIALALGSHTITVYSTKTHWTPDPVSVTVASGFVDVPVRLDPAAAIQTSVQASDDASVHPEFCVLPVYPSASPQDFCSDTTTGNVLIGPLKAATVQLFAMPIDDFPGSTSVPAYGAQWVGAHGGTGDQREARRLQLTVGTVTALPPIRVDHAGSITGIVGPPNGQSNIDYYAQPYGLQPGLQLGWGYGPGISVATLIGSTYNITGLGPYAWPVEFSSRGGYADQWSGNARDRYGATLVQVQSGQATVLNATLVPGNDITGSFYATPPTTDTQGWVYSVNSVTGDETGFGVNGGNSFWISGLNSESVRLIYQLYPSNGSYYEYPFTVPTSGPYSKGVVLTSVAPWPQGPVPNPPSGRRVPGAAGPPVPPRPGIAPWPPAPGTSWTAAPDASSPSPSSAATAPGVPSYSAGVAAPRRRSAKPWFF